MDCIGVVGAGVMGRGIAQVSAAAGLEVKIFDVAAERAKASVEFAAGMLRRAAEKGQLSPAAAEEACARMQVCTELEHLRGVDMVIEAAAEELEVKRGLFSGLETIVDEGSILATNTSSLVVTQIAAACRRPHRVAGLHFFNPVPLMKLVEIIPGLLTEPSVVQRLTGYVRRLGHEPVLAADSPGFLVNHAGRAFYTEGVRIITEGIASPFDVDRVAREALGFRMGPFELFDHTGLDVSYPVLQQIYRQFFEEPRFRPHPLLARQVAAGLYGKKSGRGFYRYEDGARIDPPQEACADGRERPVWVADRGEDGGRLRATLGELGVRIDEGREPHAESVIVLLPYGADATTAASRQGLALERAMALDMLVWPVARLSIMPSVATRPEYRDSLHAMLCRRGLAVTRIHDSPGFIAQRMLASIVNLACEIAQQRIAVPEDIDRAVRLGLGYPKGPLGWGSEIGPRRILEILDNLAEFYRDPRYRPSPWLRRRAFAGLPLDTPDP